MKWLGMDRVCARPQCYRATRGVTVFRVSLNFGLRFLISHKKQGKKFLLDNFGTLSYLAIILKVDR